MNKDNKLLFESYQNQQDLIYNNFILECEQIGKEFSSSVLEEGIYDRTKARVAGAFGGEGAKESNLINSFKLNLQKVLTKLDNDVRAVGHKDPKLYKLIQKAQNSVSNADQTIMQGLGQKAKAGALGAAKGIGKVSAAIEKPILATIEKISAKAEKIPAVKNAQEKYNDLAAKVKQKFPKASGAVDELGEIMKRNPGKTALVIGGLTAALAYSGVGPGAFVTGALLRGIAGKIKGEPVSKIVSRSLATAGIGQAVGLGAREVADMLGGAEDAADAALDSGEGADTGLKVTRSPDGTFKLEPGVKELIDQKTEIMLRDIEGVKSASDLDPRLRNIIKRGLMDTDSSTSSIAADRQLDLMIKGYRTDGELGGFKQAINKYIIKNLANDTEGRFYGGLGMVDDNTFDPVGSAKDTEDLGTVGDKKSADPNTVEKPEEVKIYKQSMRNLSPEQQERWAPVKAKIDKRFEWIDELKNKDIKRNSLMAKKQILDRAFKDMFGGEDMRSDFAKDLDKQFNQ